MSNSSVFNRSTKNDFALSVKLVGTINMQELQEFINGRSSCTTNCLAGMYGVCMQYCINL